MNKQFSRLNLSLFCVIGLVNAVSAQDSFDVSPHNVTRRTGSQSVSNAPPVAIRANKSRKTGSQAMRVAPGTQTAQPPQKTARAVNPAVAVAAPGSINLNGQWMTAYRNPDGSQVNGLMTLTQKGANLAGTGGDANHQCSFEGQTGITKDGKVQVQLKKQNLTAQRQPLGPPLIYTGVVDAVAPQGPYFLHISGQWIARRPAAGKQPALEVKGDWEAALTKPAK